MCPSRTRQPLVPKSKTVLVVALVGFVIMSVLVAISAILSLTVAEDIAVENLQDVTRVYYIAAEEHNWDYAPMKNDVVEYHEIHAKKRLEAGTDPPRLGRVYRKALFREYTDGSFREAKEREPWLGILGPLIVGEAGNTLEIHLHNNASHPVSLHSHGVQYEKQHEGALYQDNTLSVDKKDDKVLPGDTYTYYWKIPQNRGPTASDTDCMVWAYHSHVHGDTDIHTGLVGPLFICKPGSMANISSGVAVNPSYALLFLIFDESQSWYFDDNIASLFPNASNEEVEEIKENERFQESNQLYSINGYMYDNLPGLEMCLGSNVTWQLIGMGNEHDIHSVTFEGHSISLNGHRTDVAHLLPAKFVTASMLASHEGNWSLKSEVGDHSHAGMQASFSVKRCDDVDRSISSLSSRNTRTFYIAAEEIIWNYAPSEKNNMNGLTLIDDSEAMAFFEKTPNRIGGNYKKVVYREYPDDTFQMASPHASHLGFLGPTLRVEEGETLEVVFVNKASRPYSLQSTAFVKLNNGIQNSPPQKNDAILPGQNTTYRWFISRDLAPTSQDPQCITWRYFSDVDSFRDTYAGLNGVLLTCRPGSLTDAGIQKNVDKEFALMFAVIDENNSPYLEENINLYINDSESIDRDDEDFVESNLMHSINGLMYGNLMGLDLCIHDNVSWHLLAIGHVVDLHVAHFRGNAFLYNGLYRDTVELLPGSHHTVVMETDALGKWLIECRTNDHHKGGMQAWYHVTSCGQTANDASIPREQGIIREYFIAAIEEEWDYAPSERLHIVTGQNLTENGNSRLFVTRDDSHIGAKYKKVLFREYTDSSFSDKKTRTKDEEHLGILGPLIKAEVGDVVRIVFRNNASREYNIRPHGAIESVNGTASTGDVPPVQPGSVQIYTWNIPKRSGPSEGGFNCTTWAYYSAVDSSKDTNSGLVGPLVICKPGTLNQNGSRRDVDREFSVLFTVLDENESWYLEDNIAHYCLNPESVNREDKDFTDSNLKHAINGRIYGTLSGLEGRVGDAVAWYLISLGTEVDLHTAHFHGLTYVEKDDISNDAGHRADVVDLLPGVFRTVEMTFDTAGTWMFHCHVDQHLKHGMSALITVKEAD